MVLKRGSTAAPLATATAPAVKSVAAAPAAVAVNDNHHAVTSPMVGTFYKSPSPDASPFVKEGGCCKRWRYFMYSRSNETYE